MAKPQHSSNHYDCTHHFIYSEQFRTMTDISEWGIFVILFIFLFFAVTGLYGACLVFLSWLKDRKESLTKNEKR